MVNKAKMKMPMSSEAQKHNAMNKVSYFRCHNKEKIWKENLFSY